MADDKKKQLTRPPLGRDKGQNVRFSPEEYAEQMVLAAKNGLRLGNYIRQCLGLKP